MRPKLPTIILFSKLGRYVFPLLIKANVVIIFMPKVQIFAPLSQDTNKLKKKKMQFFAPVFFSSIQTPVGL